MKLSPLTFFLIMLSIGLAAFSYGFFQHWMPNKKETGYYTTYVEQLQAEADKLPRAKKRVKDAEELVNAEAEKWTQVATVHTPPADLSKGGINLNVNAWQLTVDSRKYRNSVQIALNNQLRKGGVKIVGAGPQIPFPEDTASTIVANYFNYPFIPFPVVIFELGSVTVQGTYRQITDHVRAWSNMPNYLAVADGLRLDGTSPILTGTYNLTIVGYIQTKEVYPPVLEGSGGAQGGNNNAPGGPVPGSPQAGDIRIGQGKRGAGTN